MSEIPATARPGRALFLLSFLALFLELLLIRWVPTAVFQVAYFANLLLISSFLGLGLGALVASRPGRLSLFPVLLLTEVAIVALSRGQLLPTSSGEIRFGEAGRSSLEGYGTLLAVFALNTLTFVPLGQRVGQLFQALPPLEAYTWDLGGSLAGTIAYGAFSYTAFSPVWGLCLAAGLFLLAAPRREWRWAPLILLAAAATVVTTDRGATWSPYYYITVAERGSAMEWGAEAPQDIRTRRDPPMYFVSVNRFFFQLHGTLDPSRYDDAARRWPEMERQYQLPYSLGGARPERVLVLGAGGGLDVEAARLAGAPRVDAVEIDPGIVRVARRYAASGAYDDPHVRLVVDDARAVLARLEPGYDRVIFGYLDSQALFSAHGSVRLDGFVHTVESYRAAWRLLSPRGVLVVSFFVAGQPWLAEKLTRMVEAATGRPPAAYTDGGRLVLLASPGPFDPPPAVHQYQRLAPLQPGSPPVPLATDDWPYLYLRGREIPLDYALVIGALALASLLTVALLRPRGGDLRHQGQMFCLGAGFLLLQTKSIGDCALYFGSTWLVTTLVVAGVLLMVLLANLAALRRGATGSYPALLVALGLVCLVPRELILESPFAVRLAWTLLVVPLPILFAGLIFSSSFRSTAAPASLFGANLIGATLGGFSEYLGMITGSRGLSLLLVAYYLASWACRPRR